MEGEGEKEGEGEGKGEGETDCYSRASFYVLLKYTHPLLSLLKNQRSK